MTFNQILSSSMKSFMEISLLVVAQETSLLGYNMIAIQVPGSQLFSWNSVMSVLGSKYIALIFSTPKCTSIPLILITGYERETML